MPKPSELDGKVALVTGAALGIGRATAMAFAQHGAKVVVSDIAGDRGKKTVALIQASGGEATFVRADVSVAQDAAALVLAAVERMAAWIVRTTTRALAARGSRRTSIRRSSGIAHRDQP